MTADNLLETSDLLKRHGDEFLLRVPSLHILTGETLCLLGPTGAGKSTLLRLLAGVEPPDRGDVFFRQSPLSQHTTPIDLLRQITLVFQNPLLLSGTVRRNWNYGVRLRGMPDSLGATAGSLMKRFGFTPPMLSQDAATLSGGQRQLVAIARALAVEPSLLLLDEPTANLDPAHVALVEDTIREDQQRRGTTVVWSTHNLFQARRVSHRTAFVLNGELIEVSSTESFFDSPSDPRTADFVQGKMVC